MSPDSEPTPVSLILGIAAWAVVAVLAAMIAPYVALSLYAFFTIDDIVLYENVKTLGVLGTIDWYYRISIARFTTVSISATIAAAPQFLGLNPWTWLKIWSLSSFAILFMGLWMMIRTMLPGLRASGTLILVLLPMAPLMAFPYERTGDLKVLSENSMPWVLSIYTTSAGVFALLMAFMVMAMEAMDRPKGARVMAGSLLALSFFLFTGMHELQLAAMGLFLASLLWVASRWAGRERLSSFAPLCWIRVGRALRDEFDTRFFNRMFFWLCILWVLSTVIQLMAPSTLLRQQYLPARMSLPEALWQGMGETAELFGEMFDTSQPEFLLSLLAAFAITRVLGPRRSLAIRNRFLLVPIVVPLSVGWIGISLNIMQEGGINIRSQYYALLLSYIATLCLAVYAAAALPPMIPRKAWLGIGGLLVAAVVYKTSDNPLHREAVNQALGSGLNYARGIAHRVERLTYATGDVAYVPELESPPSWVQPVVRGQQSGTVLYFNSKLAIAYGKKGVAFYTCRPPTTEADCDRIVNPAAKALAEAEAAAKAASASE